jgi:DNA-directed RNA polymerase subunit H (RpoH/RPB5)
MNTEVPQLLPIEKSNYQKINIIKTNIVKMFYHRGYIKAENLQNSINKLVVQDNDDYEYTLTLDIDSNYNTTIKDKKIIIKLFDYKISSINKTSPIGEFITKYNNIYKFIVVEDINSKSVRIISGYSTPCEIFKISELMLCIVEHTLVPNHKVLTKEEANIVLNERCARMRDMPLILTTDPIARFYNMKPDEICRIIRPSILTVETPFYRIVVMSKEFKAKI